MNATCEHEFASKERLYSSPGPRHTIFPLLANERQELLSAILDLGMAGEHRVGV
jgi:hypothetical protein